MVIMQQLSATESVQGTPLPLQSIHHIHSCNSLPFSVLRVGDGIPDHILQEHFQHPPGLLVDEATDPLDATPASQTSDGRLGDPLDIIPQHLWHTLE